MNLSIVYSTRREKKNFSRHIQKSCGLKNVQILAYVNDGRKSLSEVYNQGLAEAGNDLIVFMHDDLGFEERGWGRKIIKHFQNSEFGILGVAGAAALPETGVWWQDPGRTIGIVKHRHNGKTWLSKYSRNFKDKIIPAVCVDGLFIAVNRNRLRKNFDGEVTGFHFYDIAFCMDNHLAGVKTGVIFDVRITHKSIGQTGEAWERSRERFVSARKHMLPCAVKAELVFEEKTIELKNPPKLSVIIPHKSNNFLLFNCLNSFAEKSRYPNYEVIVADTGSSSR
ncbi:MAG: hypothetical protein GY862_36265, partial [Gammaproteobacteria bacterium]|nr:hypothetical protein [Gammaproteobacteria bacterium]